MCDADLLILMSDIDGLYTGDPNKDPMLNLSNVYRRLIKAFMTWQAVLQVILVQAAW